MAKLSKVSKGEGVVKKRVTRKRVVKKEPPLLAVKDLKKYYSKKSGYVVKGISFEVGRGEIHAFVGSNGAGKTTTIKCIVDAYKN